MPGHRWSIRIAMVLALAAAITFAATSGGFKTAEDGFDTATASVRSVPVSGQLHLVEMDAASMAEYRRWPWPREYYGNVVDHLNAAGVRSIAFDVDFSASSNPASDQAFVDAVARSDAKIILPTFSQSENFHRAGGEGERRTLDALPIAPLRDHAALGSVSMFPDRDGMVRKMPLGTITQGLPRPALAAQIAKRSGEIGQAFSIDLAIDPRAIPRHSFADIERGSFDAGSLQGKDVLIGATAVELFDRYPVPGHGVIPGVVLQAMAVETLYKGVPSSVGYGLPLILAIAVSLWILSAASYQAIAARALFSIMVFSVVDPAAWVVFRAEVAIVPALSLLVTAAILQSALILRLRNQEAKLIDRDTGLPNLQCFERDAEHNDRKFVVVGMIAEFETLRAVIGASHFATLFARIVDRLSVAGCDSPVYRVDDRSLAWTTNLDLYELEGQIAGLSALMRSPVEIAGHRFDLDLSFGIAESYAVSGAVHAASQALKNKEIWRYHEDAQSAALAQQISLMGELDDGVVSGQLQVFYQPKLDLASDTIASVEALVRWEHPTRGFLCPDTFIPLAEENDRITDLTLFVLRRTIEDLCEWRARGMVIGAAVNISAKLVTSQLFLDKVRAILSDSGIPRGQLTFEITESAQLADSDAARAGLLEFQRLGIAISMDDYGTGQSTLSYIKNLPLSELKIDRSFVQFAHINKSDAVLVRSTVQLAHELGLRVVAEGVEDEECLAFLRSIQCDYAQGYLIGKPMSAKNLATLTSIRQPLAA